MHIISCWKSVYNAIHGYYAIDINAWSHTADQTQMLAGFKRWPFVHAITLAWTCQVLPVRLIGDWSSKRKKLPLIPGKVTAFSCRKKQCSVVHKLQLAMFNQQCWTIFNYICWKNFMRIGSWWHDDIIQTELALEAQGGNAIKPLNKRRHHFLGRWYFDDKPCCLSREKKTSLKLGSRKTPFEPWKTNHPIRSKASVSGFLLEKHPKSMPRYSGVWRQNAEVNSCLSHGKDKGWSHSMVIMVSFCCASNKFDLLRRSPVSFLGLSAAIWQRLSLAHSHLRHFPIVSGSIQVLRRQPHIRLTACGYELTNTATTLVL